MFEYHDMDKGKLISHLMVLFFVAFSPLALPSFAELRSENCPLAETALDAIYLLNKKIIKVPG